MNLFRNLWISIKQININFWFQVEPTRVRSTPPRTRDWRTSAHLHTDTRTPTSLAVYLRCFHTWQMCALSDGWREPTEIRGKLWIWNTERFIYMASAYWFWKIVTENDKYASSIVLSGNFKLYLRIYVTFFNQFVNLEILVNIRLFNKPWI